MYTVFVHSSPGAGKMGKALIAPATQQAQTRKQSEMPQPLREAADIYERYTVEIAKASDHSDRPWDVVS